MLKRKIALTACSKGVDRQAESNDTTTVSEYHSEALKTAHSFLLILPTKLWSMKKTLNCENPNADIGFIRDGRTKVLLRVR